MIRMVSLLLFSFALLSSAAAPAADEATPDTYAATDALGRRLPLGGDPGIPAPSPTRRAGIFYFLWHGEHGRQGPYDISKIIARHPDAATNPARWGGRGVYHWWGEPLFGYYTNRDEWVMRKHIEALTDAGIDFIVFDTTNAVTYTESALLFLKLLAEYAAQGFRVPQAAFYTHTASGDTINRLHREIYAAHPEYAPLWFRIDGKPLVIGHPDDPALAPECRKFFRIKQSQWPNVYDKKGKFFHYPDGFPWISFENRPHHFTQVRPSVMSVSVAQHCGTVSFSASALYGDRTNHTRSWHNGANDPAPDAPLRGYNFAEQFEYALKQRPDLLFFTGWNEWIAGDWGTGKGPQPLLFVDCCDLNNSRDIEPMRGGYGDNYYLQLAGFIRRYKGAAVPPRATRPHPVDFRKGFRDWTGDAVWYRDYAGDTAGRDAAGYGKLHYRNRTGRNDFVRAAVAHDRNFLYFYIETRRPVTSPDGGRWMMLLLNTGRPNRPNWHGYDFVLNRTAPTRSHAVLERCAGDWRWQSAAACRYQLAGNKLQIAVPLQALDLTPGVEIALEFKWSDNQLDAEKAPGIDVFYTDGDAAPGGRMNYLYRFRP